MKAVIFDTETAGTVISVLHGTVEPSLCPLMEPKE